MTPIILDSIIGIVILLSTGVAFYRGFLKEALTIVNILGGAAGAYFLGPLMSPTFRVWMGAGDNADKSRDLWGFIPPEVSGTFLAYAVGFFGVFIILMAAGMYLSGTLKAMGFGPMDRFLGMLFGLARAFLLIFLVYLPFGYFMQPEEYPVWAKQSISVPVLDKSYVWINDYLIAEKDADAEKAKNLDPNTVEGRLHRMKQGLIKQEQIEKAAPVESEILPVEPAPEMP